MAVKVGGEAAKAGKPVERYYGYLEIAKGAWNSWLRSKDWSGMGRVVLDIDHMERAREILASTVNNTLSFERKEVGSEEWLAYAAEIADGETASTAQRDMAALLAQGIITDVSVGLILLDYDWELARDPDNDRDMDTLVGKKVAMRALSVVTFGAMGPDGNISILADEMSATMGAGSIRLEAGPMREYLMGSDGEPMSREASQALIRGSKAAAEAELDNRLAAASAVPRPAADRVAAVKSRLGID